MNCKECLLCIIMLMVAFPSSAQDNLLGAPDIVPPATKEMQNPAFWSSKIDNPNRVVMTPSEIEDFNAKNRMRKLTRKDINGNEIVVAPMLMRTNFSGIFFHISNPLDVKTIPGAEITAHLEREKEFIVSSEHWDRRQILFPDWRKKEIADELNINTVPQTVAPRYGVTVRHTLSRNAPTHEKVYNGQYHWLDMYMNAVIETNSPVAVLHASKTGDWLFVRSDYSFGWVPAENIAIGSAKKIRSITEADDFIVATGHKVPVYADRACSVWHGDLYMGARLRLKQADAANYTVVSPVRKPDGTVATINGYIKSDAPVTVGYQSYTQRNVIETIFSLLGRPYGWGGSDNERDCVGTIRAVMRTFGIFTPRWTEFQLSCSDHVTTFPADTPITEKYRLLSQCEPGITVTGFDWHVLLYIGEVDGVHYVIHQNGFAYHDDKGDELRVARVSVNHTELEGGADIKRWTELSVFKK